MEWNGYYYYLYMVIAWWYKTLGKSTTKIEKQKDCQIEFESQTNSQEAKYSECCSPLVLEKWDIRENGNDFLESDGKWEEFCENYSLFLSFSSHMHMDRCIFALRAVNGAIWIKLEYLQFSRANSKNPSD